jgi:hypothetical protein
MRAHAGQSASARGVPPSGVLMLSIAAERWLRGRLRIELACVGQEEGAAVRALLDEIGWEQSPKPRTRVDVEAHGSLVLRVLQRGLPDDLRGTAETAPARRGAEDLRRFARSLRSLVAATPGTRE